MVFRESKDKKKRKKGSAPPAAPVAPQRKKTITHRSVMGALGEAAESLPIRARYIEKCALRTGVIRWHVSELFLVGRLGDFWGGGWRIGGA